MKTIHLNARESLVWSFFRFLGIHIQDFFNEACDKRTGNTYVCLRLDDTITVDSYFNQNQCF